MRIGGQLLIALTVVAGSVVLCAAGGGVLGNWIGTRYPGYYRTVFPTAATQPDVDRAQLGTALGVTQGAAAGLLVGAVIVLALAIAHRRRGPGPDA